MIKLGIIRVTAEGEQCNIEAEVSPNDIVVPEGKTFDEALHDTMAPYFKLLDDRLWEMNCRIMASNELDRSLEPEARMAVRHVCEVLMGQVPRSDIDKLVKQGQDRREIELAELAIKENEKKGKKIH